MDARLLLFRGEAAAWAPRSSRSPRPALVRGARAAERRAAVARSRRWRGAPGSPGARRATRSRSPASARGSRALGGRREGPRCTLLVPAEKPAAAADALLAECEFHADDLARALGLDAPPHVTVTVHRSAAEKRRLVGAAATDFAKPWLGEVHVVDARRPTRCSATSSSTPSQARSPGGPCASRRARASSRRPA